MNQYRESLENRGCKRQTISIYFCYLNRLYTFLPDTKELTDENLQKWVADLKSRGYSDRTINLHLSSVDGLLKFCGHENVPVSVISVPRCAEMPELTRDEYLELLSCTKKRGLDRSNITHSIEKLGEEAGIKRGKCNPSSLHRLYRRTQEEISQQLISLHRQAYEQMWEEEQAKINLEQGKF